MSKMFDRIPRGDVKGVVVEMREANWASSARKGR